MALPHAAFVGASVGFKILFPSILTWLATETYATALLSVWYPLMWTIGLIHSKRYPSNEEEDDSASPLKENINTNNVKHMANKFDRQATTPAKAGKTAAMVSKSSLSPSKQTPSYMRATAAQESRARSTKVKLTTKTTGVFPKTSPQTSSPRGNPSKPNPTTTNSSQQQAASPQPFDSTDYWLRYWSIYACVQALRRVTYLIPIFGGFLTNHPVLATLGAEIRLVFFIWLFTMEGVLATTSQDAILAQALPLRLLHRYVIPRVMECHTAISEAVSEERWQKTVISNARRILDILVLIKFLSEQRKDWLLHILEESRSLVVPSVSLLMPGFITQFGVAYVQFVLPTCKSQTSDKVLYLQYWVLHCIWSGLLAWFASILWWIPFSTHAIYLSWCHVSFPRTIAQYYTVLEAELLAFGILKGRDDDILVAVHETRTFQFLQSLAKRLPSAAESDWENRVEDNNNNGGVASDNSRVLLDAEKDQKEFESENGKKAPITMNRDERPLDHDGVENVLLSDRSSKQEMDGIPVTAAISNHQESKNNVIMQDVRSSISMTENAVETSLGYDDDHANVTKNPTASTDEEDSSSFSSTSIDASNNENSIERSNTPISSKKQRQSLRRSNRLLQKTTAPKSLEK